MSKAEKSLPELLQDIASQADGLNILVTTRAGRLQKSIQDLQAYLRTAEATATLKTVEAASESVIAVKQSLDRALDRLEQLEIEA